MSPYTKLLTFYAVNSWFGAFSTSILPAYYLSQGLTIQTMIFSMFFYFSSQLFLLLFMQRGMSSRLSWKLSLFTFLLFLSLSIKVFSPLQLYIASFFDGMSLIFFFVFYNIAHFKLTPKKSVGGSSALLFNTSALVGIVAPILAGFVITKNSTVFWLISALSFLITYSLIKRQDNFSITIDLKKGILELKKTRIFIFLEGIWEALIFAIIPIYSVHFLKNALDLGIYISYLSIVSVLANYLLGKLSDKVQKRIIFIYPITLALALVTALFPFAVDSLIYWVIATTAVKLIVPLFWSMTLSLVVDTHKDLGSAIPGREFILSLGRLLGVGVCSLSFILESPPKLIFYFLAFVMFLFPTILFWRTKIARSHEYL